MAITDPQQLNLADRITLRSSLVLRITANVADYALYILGGGVNDNPNVANLKQWASNAIQNASLVADQASWHVVNQDSFKNGGTSIEDAELQGIVQAAINNHFVTPLT